MAVEGNSESRWFGAALNDWRKQSGITCSFVIFAALNIAMMVVGIRNLRDCPAEKMVPIYLIGERQST